MHTVGTRILVTTEAGTLSPVLRDLVGKQTFDSIVIEGLGHVLKALRNHRPAVVVFDVHAWSASIESTLWELSELRDARTVRKVVVSAVGSTEDMVAALDLGADAFLTKPISARELEARIFASLRTKVTVEADRGLQTIGTLCLDRGAMQLSVEGTPIALTAREFHLLAFLMDHAGEVFARHELIENVWDPRDEIEDARVVDVFVCRLRDKIEADPSNPKILLTRRGEGYSLVDPTK